MVVGICDSSSREMETGRPWGLVASLPNLGEHQAENKAYLRNQGGGYGDNLARQIAVEAQGPGLKSQDTNKGMGSCWGTDRQILGTCWLAMLPGSNSKLPVQKKKKMRWGQ